MTAVVAFDAEAPPATVPVFALQPFAPPGSAPRVVFAIDGGIVVADGVRVGKIAGEGIEWIGKIPKTTPGIGDNIIVNLVGRLPDDVGAIYETMQGRAPEPTYVAITGKAATHTEAPGGGWGLLFATQVGDSTVLAGGSSFEGFHIPTVRGPKLPRRLTPAKALCKPDEVFRTVAPETNVAIEPRAFESTTEGRMVSLGNLCEKRGPSAEVWDKATGTSQIVDLGAWWQHTSYGASLLRGPGDELWAFSDPFHPMLHYAAGKFEPLPLLDAPIQNVFVSPSGELHAYTSTKTLYRFADGKWSAIGRTAEPAPPRTTMAIDSVGGLWAGAKDKVYRLRETSRAPATQACASWLVYLYEASTNNGTNYGYPSTRKALSSFAEAGDVGLVEFGSYPRHVGVTVKSRAQGEAVIAHVRATMKDEVPRLFCHVPESARKIP